MADTVIVGIFSLIGTLTGSIAGIMTANRLTIYRIEQLEKKVERHNNVVERMAIAERDLQAAFRLIDGLKPVN